MVGLSPSTPGMRSTGVPAAPFSPIGTRKMWLRRPSFQVSQWRTKTWSKIRPEALSAARPRDARRCREWNLHSRGRPKARDTAPCRAGPTASSPTSSGRSVTWEAERCSKIPTPDLRRVGPRRQEVEGVIAHASAGSSRWRGRWSDGARRSRRWRRSRCPADLCWPRDPWS